MTNRRVLAAALPGAAYWASISQLSPIGDN
jgi:hypothetical protein